MRVRLSNPALPLLCVLLLGWGLRLFRLADADIWWDEGWSVGLGRLPLWESAWQTARDVHPPLHTWLLHGWRALVGESEFALRASSALLGTLTITALYGLGRQLFPGRALPLIAALLLAVSRFHIWWSQELRSYVLGGLLVVLSLVFTVRLRWRPSLGTWVGFLLATIAAVWTLYLLLLLLAIQTIYWLWTLRREPQRGPLLARWGVAQAGVLLGSLPWLLYALPLMRSGSAGASEGAFPPFAALFATLLTLGSSTSVERTLPLVLAVLLVAAVGLGRARDAAQRDGGVLLGATLLVPLLLVWLVTAMPRSIGYLPRPEARYLLPFAPAFSLLLAWAVVGLSGGRRWWRGVALGGVLLLSLWSSADYLAGRYRSDDYPSLAATLRAYAQPEDGVLLHSDKPWPIFTYHWGGTWQGTPHLQEADPSSVAFQLEPLWAQHETIWLVVNDDGLRIDPSRLYERWLAERATSQQEWGFGEARLIRFSKNVGQVALVPFFDPPPPPHRLSGEGWELVGWEQPLQRLRVGQPLHLALTVKRAGWSGEVELALGEPPLADAPVTIPPGEGLWRGEVTLRPPPDAPGGVLSIRITIDGQDATIGSIELLPLPPPPPATPIDPEHRLDATFGDPVAVRLLGYDLEGEAEAGGSQALTLYWEAVHPMPTAYKAFVHLVDETGEIVAQSDAEPVNGTRPTTTWLRGERLADVHALILPETLSGGRYTLSVGLYDPISGGRLAPVREETIQPQPTDHLILGSVVVE